jgi:hypothetical protein
VWADLIVGSGACMCVQNSNPNYRKHGQGVRTSTARKQGCYYCLTPQNAGTARATAK